MLFLESKFLHKFSVFNKQHVYEVWRYKVTNYYKFVMLLIWSINDQHVTEELYTVNAGKVTAYLLAFLYVHLSLGYFYVISGIFGQGSRKFEKRKVEVRLTVHMTSLTSAECDCVHAKEIARNHCFHVLY